ncbi:MAG: phosphopantothenoylcysteine decarboxylase [Verrucomicrobiota bacterium]
MPSPYVLITCGPAYAPVDDVRRLTNFSTGEFGTLMAETFRDAGWRVVCCRGDNATFRPPGEGVELHDFGTNQGLEKLLARLAADPTTSTPDLLLHAAALSDFEVASVQPLSGEGSALPDPDARKLASLAPGWMLRLRRVAKLLPKLRALFPNTGILGWKYLLDGSRDDALAAGREQMEACGTVGCLLNGTAWGPGYGLLRPPADVVEFESKQEVAAYLSEHLKPPALREAS